MDHETRKEGLFHPGSPGELPKHQEASPQTLIGSSEKPRSHSLPPDELFIPENRRRLLDFLTQTQFPSLREVVGKALEAGYFLSDPAEVTFALIQKIIVDADDYDPRTPYWNWIESLAAESIQEYHQDAAQNGHTGKSAEEKNERMRLCFNGLPLEERRALYLVGVMGYTVEEACRLSKEDPQAIVSQARGGLQRIIQQMDGSRRRDSHVG